MLVSSSSVIHSHMWKLASPTCNTSVCLHVHLWLCYLVPFVLHRCLLCAHSSWFWSGQFQYRTFCYAIRTMYLCYVCVRRSPALFKAEPSDSTDYTKVAYNTFRLNTRAITDTRTHQCTSQIKCIQYPEVIRFAPRPCFPVNRSARGWWWCGSHKPAYSNRNRTH